MNNQHQQIPVYDTILPAEWELKTIDQVSSRVGSGVTPTGGSEVYTTEGVLFIRSQNVRFEGLDLDDVAFIDQRTHHQMSVSKVLPYDVLINITGASIGRCCSVPDGLGEANQNQHVCTIRIHEATEEDSKFLASTLSSPIGQGQISRLNAGGNREGLNYQQLRSFHIVWPPKPERHRIAEILSTVDRAIEQTEALIAKQQRLKTGLMQDILTRGIDPHGNLRSEQTHKFKDSPLGRIPVEWEVKKLGSLLISINQGWSPDCESDPAAQGEWGVLRTTAVVWEGYQDYENKCLPLMLAPRPHLEIQVGDLLMTRAGPNSRVGVIAYVYSTRSKLILSDKIYRLVPTKEADSRFLCYALSSSASQRHLSNLKTGMAESQTNISQEIVKALMTVCPPSAEQSLIADRLDHISSESNKSTTVLAKLRALKTALMQDLLTGRKRVTALLNETEVPT